MREIPGKTVTQGSSLKFTGKRPVTGDFWQPLKVGEIALKRIQGGDLMAATRSRLVYLEGQPYWKHPDGGFEKIEIFKESFPEQTVYCKTRDGKLKKW